MALNRPRVPIVAAAVLAFVLAAYGSSSSSSASSSLERSHSPAVLTIGVPLALTGPIAAQARQMEDGYNLYLKQHGGKIGGVPAKLVFADDQGDATQATVKTRGLITQSGINLIGGGALALESLAIEPVATRSNIAFITPISSADNLTQRKLSPLFARTNMTSSQPNLYFADYAYRTLGYRRMVIVEQDYAYGWESGGGFQYAFQKDGGKIVKKIYVPLNATDLTPYISHIPRNVDAVYAILVGSFVPRFEAEYRQSTLQGKVHLIGGPDMIDEDALDAAGANAVGMIGVHEYYKGQASVQPFVRAFRAAYHQTPSYWGESTYITAQWLAAAVKRQEAAGTKPADIPGWIRSNPKTFINDVVASRIQAPQGPMHMDRFHNAVMTLYIFRVTAPGTKKILKRIPNATQFWTESPSKFLAHPVFSRTYP